MFAALLSWLVLIGPLALAAVALVPPRAADRRPALMARLGIGAAGFALAAALLSGLALVATGNPVTRTFAAVPVFGVEIALTIWLDTLSAVMLVLVTFIGLTVTVYSRNYLAGDPGQGRFTAALCGTLAAVLLVVVSGHLAMLTAAWIATSLCLHRLLVFYSDRPKALLAARKKAIASRIGDVCVIAAIILIARTFGSLDLGVILAAAKTMQQTGAVDPAVTPIAVLLATGAAIKSAQFPVHGWLPEVMETPTPVSALLHAGLINAGGFLVIRMADVMVLSPGALHLLAVVGGFTALFGAAVMLTQTSVKVTLAWSTVAQMGFMMLQCGLGAFASAMLHLVAHALYKAHAFLSAGSVIDEARRTAFLPAGEPAGPGATAVAAVVLVALALVGSGIAGLSLATAPGVVALGAVLCMSLAPLLAAAATERRRPAAGLRVLGLAAAMAAAYVVLQLAAGALFGPALPAPRAGILDSLVAVLVILGFLALVVLQAGLRTWSANPRLRTLYVHLFNGLYINALADRLVARIWPVRARSLA